MAGQALPPLVHTNVVSRFTEHGARSRKREINAALVAELDDPQDWHNFRIRFALNSREMQFFHTEHSGKRAADEHDARYTFFLFDSKRRTGEFAAVARARAVRGRAARRNTYKYREKKKEFPSSHHHHNNKKTCNI